jgi:hypothetical protein
MNPGLSVGTGALVESVIFRNIGLDRAVDACRSDIGKMGENPAMAADFCSI